MQDGFADRRIGRDDKAPGVKRPRRRDHRGRRDARPRRPPRSVAARDSATGTPTAAQTKASRAGVPLETAIDRGDDIGIEAAPGAGQEHADRRPAPARSAARSRSAIIGGAGRGPPRQPDLGAPARWRCRTAGSRSAAALRRCPFATAVIVPSPPAATITSNSASACARAAPPSPERGPASRTTTAQPRRRSAATTRSRCRRCDRDPAGIGLTMISTCEHRDAAGPGCIRHRSG